MVVGVMIMTGTRVMGGGTMTGAMASRGKAPGGGVFTDDLGFLTYYIILFVGVSVRYHFA